MSIGSSSKPHSVINTLGTGDKIYTLVFKTGSQGKRLSQDAIYVCQLLAIHPEDLMPRDFDTFAEKGLSEKRQLLRYEHYEEKRHLKLKAIQNVLLKCMTKEASGEVMQVQALIEDLKKQSQSTKNQYSPFKSHKNQSKSFMSPDQPEYKSQYLDNMASKQMERVMEKIDKWQKIKEIASQKKIDSQQRAQQILQKEKKIFDKREKNHKEQMEDLKIRIDLQQNKWRGKVTAKKDMENKEEAQKHQKAKEILNETMNFFHERNRKVQSLNEKISRPYLDRQHNSVESSTRIPMELSQEDHQKVQAELEKLESKLKRAEMRNFERKAQIMTRGQNHSQLVQKRKEDYDQRMQERHEELLGKTVNKAMRAQTNQDSRIKEINMAAEKLQEIHRRKEEKFKHQEEEERRNLQQQLNFINQKMNKTEQKISEKRAKMLDQISGKKEKRKLQFEDKAENERRLKMMQMNMKQQIFEKHIEKEKKIIEMKKVWLNNSVQEISVIGL